MALRKEVDSENMPRLEQGKHGQPTDQSHDKPCIEPGIDINEPTIRTGADQLTKNTNVEEETEKKGPYLQPTEPLQDLPQRKSAEIASLGDEEASESDRARIERLGRERPEKFKSFGAELAFCYSVIASQFMSVRFVVAPLAEREI